MNALQDLVLASWLAFDLYGPFQAFISKKADQPDHWLWVDVSYPCLPQRDSLLSLIRIRPNFQHYCLSTLWDRSVTLLSLDSWLDFQEQSDFSLAQQVLSSIIELLVTRKVCMPLRHT